MTPNSRPRLPARRPRRPIDRRQGAAATQRTARPPAARACGVATPVTKSMARGKPPRRGGSSKSKWVPSSPYAIAAFLVGLIGALAMWFGGDDAGPEPPRGAAQAGLDACVDKAADCKTWAQQGECTINAEYMHTNCRAACGLCPAEPFGRPSGGDRGRVDRRYMCSRAPDERPILAPGTMGRVFQDAVDRFPQYKPTIHSTDPWVVTFDELFSEEEAKRIFELGAKGMARSASVAGIDENGQFKKQISDVRTSENSWCVDSDCGTDPVVRRVTQRIAEITQSSPKSFELYQVLRCAPQPPAPQRCVGRARPTGCARARVALRADTHRASTIGSTTTGWTRTRISRSARACTPSSCTCQTWRRAAGPLSPGSTSPSTPSSAGRCGGPRCSPTSPKCRCARACARRAQHVQARAPRAHWVAALRTPLPAGPSNEPRGAARHPGDQDGRQRVDPPV